MGAAADAIGAGPVVVAGASGGGTVGGALPVQATTANAATNVSIVRVVRVGRSCGDIQGLRR